MKKVAEITPEYLQTPNILNKEKSNEQTSSYDNDQGYEIDFTNKFLIAGFKFKLKNSSSNFDHIREQIKL